MLVPGSIKLPKLHVVLLYTMGWMGGHLHEFIIGDRNFGMPDQDYPQIGLERGKKTRRDPRLKGLN